MATPGIAIDHTLSARFVDAALAGIPRATLEALGVGRVRAALEVEIRTCIARTADLELAEGFRKWCPIEGATTTDYLYGIDAIGSDVALTSIRFRGGDRTRPFVQLEACTSGVAGLGGALRDAIRARYALFAPKRLRWFECARLESLPAELEPDLRLVAGSIATVIDHRPASAERLRLTVATDLSWYDRYVAGYEEYFREYPQLVGDLNYETRETLQMLLDQGKLFEAWAGESWAGIAGTWHEREKFVEGEVIVERMLVPELRGHGLGDALVWHLAAALPVPADTLLFGMISPANVRSLRSAASVGRVDVGGYVFGAL
jgi:hypothetical protein